MLDGALTVGSEAAAHITWRTPQEVDAEKLAAAIAEMIRWETPKKSDLGIVELLNRES